MRFAIVAAGAVVLGATVAEARSVASSPRRHVDKTMKRSNAHETRVEIERLNYATPSRLSKRSKLANDDWNNTSPSHHDQSNSTPSHEASSETHTRATESSDHKDEKSHDGEYHKERVASLRPAFVDRTVVSNPSGALPNNVIWKIQKKTEEESSKSGGSKFKIVPILPGGKPFKAKKAAPVAPIPSDEYMIIPVTPVKSTTDELPVESAAPELIEQASPTDSPEDESVPTTTLLRAIEDYREAVAEQTSESEPTTAQADLPHISNQKSRASKKKSSKSAKKPKKDDSDCGSDSDDDSSDFASKPEDFRTVQ
ncbi:hypothetical protein PGT21_022583 [Puccinia graminis f. sp. tritici]|uniref:Uncharacterized protein n=1 Tax=Puccinia graminis f. sp. tritici TaxID=56615 RepID=A0A5B0QJ57_PUCGR|nr:hypothetical protein PGT21_022583 [Puccinia graminis f. sp. tritici]